MKQSICLIYLPCILRCALLFIYIFIFSFHHFLYLLQAMFLIHSPIILEQSEITHWWVESFWDIDKQKAVLNDKNLDSPDNSIRESCGRKNGIELGPVPMEVRNCLIFRLWRDVSKVALYKLTALHNKVFISKWQNRSFVSAFQKDPCELSDMVKILLNLCNKTYLVKFKEPLWSWLKL